MSANYIVRDYCFIGKGVTIGKGTKIANHCVIDSEAKLGKNCNLQTGVYLATHTELGDNCFLSVRVTVLDEKYPTVGEQIRSPVKIGNGVVIGAGAVIVGGITIGDGAVIGMGSVVTKNVPARTVVAGNPARYFYNRSVYNRKKKQWESNVKYVIGS